MTRPYDTPSNGFGFTASRRRAGDYTPPGAQMAPLAALLLRNPSTAIPALIAAMDAIKGRDCTQVITDLLDKEAAK